MAMTSEAKEAQKMMLDVHALGEWDSPLYCAIEMDAHRAAGLLKLMEHVRSLRKEDGSVYALCVWDCPGQYTDDQEPEGSNEEDPYWRMDCQQVVITDDGVYWTARLKGTAYEVETDAIDRQQLREVAKSRGGRKEAKRGG
jgi:hypothetical protein